MKLPIFLNSQLLIKFLIELIQVFKNAGNEEKEMKIKVRLSYELKIQDGEKHSEFLVIMERTLSFKLRTTEVTGHISTRANPKTDTSSLESLLC